MLIDFGFFIVFSAESVTGCLIVWFSTLTS
jgi:hypothetical protein